ncbi:MAG: metalloregulator ArsR/SmtB family transcription factor [Methanomassiliicoccaceae archaeon]|nr:metalloregulator ArsR/SmtB family transcription factor [Methanomassiliicoccaceae archaeon]
MNKGHIDNALIFRALADTNRLMIIDALSHGELCACEILKGFEITQPTLSHHMNILCGCGLVNARKEGKWTHYSLNSESLRDTASFLEEIASAEQDDTHRDGTCGGCCE